MRLTVFIWDGGKVEKREQVLYISQMRNYGKQQINVASKGLTTKDLLCWSDRVTFLSSRYLTDMWQTINNEQTTSSNIATMWHVSLPVEAAVT